MNACWAQRRASPAAGCRRMYSPSGCMSHAEQLSCSYVRRMFSSWALMAGSQTGATTSIRRERLRVIQSAEPMKNSGAPPFSKR